MTFRNQLIFWTAVFAAFIGFVFLFKSILLPFVLGAAVAYLLNPLVATFAKINIRRGLAALIILGSFLLIVIVALTVISPILYKQSLQLAENVPVYADKLLEAASPYIERAMGVLGEGDDADVKSILQGQAGTAAELVQNIIGGLVAGGQAVFDLISVIIFMPIVAYFVMKEWDHITTFVEELLPEDQKDTIMDLFKQIDAKISGFVRGQISVAVILGIMYAIALTIADLNYGLLIGLGAGLLSIIPMVGSALGLLVAVVVAWFQAGEIGYVGIIAAIFLIGQLIEGNILSPKIVGESVGMHPLWVFFALLAGGSLFGILGMLIAVPLAAVAGVLLTFAIAQYKVSPYFKAHQKKSKSKEKKKKTNA